MNKKNHTRSALFTSIVSLLLCVSMLVGTTFAWFTDEVVSGNNVIAAGNLDVELYYSKTKDFTDEKKVDGQTLLFTDKDGKEIKHWEPGVVAYTNLQVANVGSLALKYQLSVNFTNETKVNDHGLSEALKVAVVEGGFEGDRAAAQALTNLVPLESLVLPGVLEGDTKSEIYGVVIYWEPTANDNLFNMNNENKGKTLSVDLGINLFATQEMYEKDSFDETYDENAQLCNFIVTNEEELVAALAEAKNGDVIGIQGNVTWTTGAAHDSTPFVESASTFSVREQAKSTSLITLIGVDETATFTAIGAGVGPIGIDNGTVTFKNLKIVDNSESYAENSWEFGYLEFRGNTVFENCEFVNAIMMDGDSAIFRSCSFNSNKDNEYAAWVSNGDATFENCYITGARGLKIHEDYGSEVGTVVINNNTFVDLTKKPGLAIGDVNADTTVTLTNNTFAGTQPGDQGNYKYESDTIITTFNMTDEKNLVAEYASDASDLNNTINNAEPGDVIMVAGGETALPSMSNKEGLTIVGAADGSTVVGGENASTGFGSNFGKDTTIKNVTFSGSTNGVRYSYAKGGTTTFEDCTFAGDSTYGFHIDQSNGATFIFNNCTFIGFNAFAGDLAKVEFNNCTFLSNGYYGHTNIWSNGYFNNCAWGDATSVGTRGNNAHLYFDGVEESYHHKHIGTADGLVDFAKSVNEGGDSWKGKKVVLVDDIDLAGIDWVPIGQTGATEFKGIFDGQNHTIYNLTIDSSNKTDGHYSSGLFGWVESHAEGVTIKNVKVDGATVTGNHNCAVIVGYLYGVVENCHVTNATVTCKHANDDACGDKAGVIVGYAGPATDYVIITNCSASNSTVIAGRDAGQLIGAGYEASVTGCSATAVAASATGECTGANINNTIIGRVLG